MLRLFRTDSSHPDFIALVAQLDADLAERDGKDHAFYAQFNKIDNIPNVVIAYVGETAVACGAVKPFDNETMEVKRMFVRPEQRGKGIASAVLAELEQWAADLLYQRCVLETGKRQEEAIHVYQKNGYRQTPNYGQYIGIENSLCFDKMLSDRKENQGIKG